MYYKCDITTNKETGYLRLDIHNKKESIICSFKLTDCDFKVHLERGTYYDYTSLFNYDSPLWIICEDDEEYIKEILADQFVENLNIIFELLDSWFEEMSIQITSIEVIELFDGDRVLNRSKIKI